MKVEKVKNKQNGNLLIPTFIFPNSYFSVGSIESPPMDPTVPYFPKVRDEYENLKTKGCLIVI